MPEFSWQITAGALPTGLEMSEQGVISGTPDPVCGDTPSILQGQVVDSDTPPQMAVQDGVELLVVPVSMRISSRPLPTGIVNVAYDARVQVTGGLPPYSFAVTTGSLPSQLMLNSNTGRITGIPDTVESRLFGIRVTDACTVILDQNLSITINAASPGRNDSLATATVLAGNGSYQASISPSGHPNTVFAPDEDYYAISTTATSTIQININAQVNGSPLDSVIEVVNAAGNVLQLCGAPAYNSECVSDDEVLGVQLDSRLQLRVTGATTFYIHVVDWASDARPDKLYDLLITGVN